MIHKLRLEAKDHEEKLERETSKKLAELEVRAQKPSIVPTAILYSSQSKKKLQDEQLAHLRQLKELEVDLTTYLVSQHPKPDNVLRVITKGSGSTVHIHP